MEDRGEVCTVYYIGKRPPQQKAQFAGASLCEANINFLKKYRIPDRLFANMELGEIKWTNHKYYKDNTRFNNNNATTGLRHRRCDLACDHRIGVASDPGLIASA